MKKMKLLAGILMIFLLITMSGCLKQKPELVIEYKGEELRIGDKKDDVLKKIGHEDTEDHMIFYHDESFNTVFDLSFNDNNVMNGVTVYQYDYNKSITISGLHIGDSINLISELFHIKDKKDQNVDHIILMYNDGKFKNYTVGSYDMDNMEELFSEHDQLLEIYSSDGKIRQMEVYSKY